MIKLLKIGKEREHMSAELIEELQHENEFLEDKIIQLEQKNKELLNAINNLKRDATTKTLPPQSAYDSYYMPTDQNTYRELQRQRERQRYEQAVQRQRQEGIMSQAQGISSGAALQAQAQANSLQGGSQNAQAGVSITDPDVPSWAFEEDWRMPL